MSQEPSIYEISSPGRCGVVMPQPDVPGADIPAELCRKNLGLPELSQIDVVRHYLHLSQLNYSIDSGFYPLGSCTMKFNPKINEDVARLTGFAFTHPLQDPLTVQGNLAIMYHLQEWFKEIGGFAGVTLQPAAGAHGEFTGVLIMRAYHLDRGDTKRNVILIPDSAHGTNPASSAMSGRQCHLRHDEAVAHDVHLPVSCGACHLKQVFPRKDRESGLIGWSRQAGSPR